MKFCNTIYTARVKCRTLQPNRFDRHYLHNITRAGNTLERLQWCVDKNRKSHIYRPTFTPKFECCECVMLGRKRLDLTNNATTSRTSKCNANLRGIFDHQMYFGVHTSERIETKRL